MVLSGINDLSNNDIVFSSFATDGIDGLCDAAGAIADGNTLDRALLKNMDPIKFLNDNNSYEFFKQLNDLFITGPTGTNVMDLQVIIKSKHNYTP
jgi:glycerate-2-kinase